MYTDIKGLQKHCGLGRKNADALAVRAGARIKIGRRVLYSIDKVDAYMDSLIEVQINESISHNIYKEEI